jgi:hypothetical protein
MSSEPIDQTPTTEVTEPTTESATEQTSSSSSSPEMGELLKQLKAQTEQNAALQAQQAEASKQMELLSSKVNEYQSVGKKRRQDALEGTVKDWVTQIVETHKNELGPYEDKLKDILSAMKNHEDATPMVQMLSCAATAHSSSTSKLNKAYQELKEARNANKRLRTQVEESLKPAFSQTSERFKASTGPAAPEKSPDAYSNMFTAKKTARYGTGMAQTNPEFYAAIKRSANTIPSGSAMRPNIDMSLYSKSRQNSWLGGGR